MTDRARTSRLDGLTPGPADPAPDDPARALRHRALTAAATAYAAAHGHPTEAPAQARSRTRWAVSRRAAVATVLGLTTVAGAVALRTLPATPEVIVELDPGGTWEEAGGPDPGFGTVPSADEGREPEEVLVHVVGEVVAPGVVRLPAGSRVVDAVEAAGGPTAVADLGAVNLARTVTDGEQVRVPAPGETLDPAAAPDGGGAPGLLDLNAATVADLDDLPGIGPVLAQRIADWRTAQGRFTRVAELTEVTGIGPALLADLEPLVTVTG